MQITTMQSNQLKSTYFPYNEITFETNSSANKNVIISATIHKDLNAC